MPSYTRSQNAALLLARFTIAAIFLYAGYGKFGAWTGQFDGTMSTTMVYIMKLLAVVEPLGAIALIVGFLTQWASRGLAIIMVGAIFYSQFTFDIGFFSPTGPGWNFNLVILAACLLLATFGAGNWSMDAKRVGGQPA